MAFVRLVPVRFRNGIEQRVAVSIAVQLLKAGHVELLGPLPEQWPTIEAAAIEAPECAVMAPGERAVLLEPLRRPRGRPRKQSITRAGGEYHS